MERYKKTTIFDELSKWCTFTKTEHDFIEITEWKNGEGFDICISSEENKNFCLTHGELDAIIALTKMINHD